MQCPVCGFWVARSPLIVRPFTCPGCGERLVLRKPGGTPVVVTVCFFLAFLLPWLGGASGVHFALEALLIFFVGPAIAGAIAGRLFGKLEAHGGGCGGAGERPGEILHL